MVAMVVNHCIVGNSKLCLCVFSGDCVCSSDEVCGKGNCKFNKITDLEVCFNCRADYEGNEPLNCKIYELTNYCKFLSKLI